MHSITKWLWPTQCLLCWQPAVKKPFCQPCFQELPWNPPGCRCCGLPLETQRICGSCLSQPPAFFKTKALFAYEPPITHFITQLKFHQQLLYANILGNLLQVHIRRNYKEHSLPQFLVPVPLHRKRLRKRGFNQALEIAKPISKKLKVPLALNASHRIKNTQPQIELPSKKRALNIKNAFKIDTSFQPEHIAIIDDVVTTGNTIRELSRLFQKNGIKKIEIWCCARASIQR